MNHLNKCIQFVNYSNNIDNLIEIGVDTPQINKPLIHTTSSSLSDSSTSCLTLSSSFSVSIF